MQHLDNARLVARHYGDDSAREREAAERHLAACGECAARLAALRQFLSAVEAPPVPERPDSYGAEVWNRIRGHLPEREERRWWQWSSQRWAVAATMAALVLGAFLLGRQWQRPAPAVATAPAAQERVRERVLLVALNDHLEKSQMVLVELANAPATGGSIDITAERQRADDLVDASRLYRQAAAESGEAALALTLDELERTLVEIARSPDQLDQAELKRIQERIEARGLIFKVRVVGSKVRREQRAHPQQEKKDVSPQSESRQRT